LTTGSDASATRVDVLCVGAGIVGLATARALAQKISGKVVVVEAEKQPALHQTGRNSGVIHSGLYYKPGSLKSQNCVIGRARLLDYCQQHEIQHELCGKLVIATDRQEIERLDELERRGRANGLTGLERLPAERIPEFEPHATGIDALWVPETGIIDYRAVAHAYARDFESFGGDLRLGTQVKSLVRTSAGLAAETSTGEVFDARYLVNCAGLQSDRVARMAGLSPALRIVPFRGDYFDLTEDKRCLLRGLIYPVPDPRFPFLGVHLTRRVDGTVETGPNAVLSFHREGYRPPRFRLADTLSTLLYPGFWRLAARFWRIGAREYLRAGSRQGFARALQRFIPEIQAADLTPGNCGIRAQALGRDGSLFDDFAIENDARTFHVLNAPSPGATASLAIGETLADRAIDTFSLDRRDAAT
jgi:L-2-hydroxyglutarate oxidase